MRWRESVQLLGVVMGGQESTLPHRKPDYGVFPFLARAGWSLRYWTN
jgi:hypothetical protein